MRIRPGGVLDEVSGGSTNLHAFWWRPTIEYDRGRMICAETGQKATLHTLCIGFVSDEFLESSGLDQKHMKGISTCCAVLLTR